MLCAALEEYACKSSASIGESEGNILDSKQDEIASQVRKKVYSEFGSFFFFKVEICKERRKIT